MVSTRPLWMVHWPQVWKLLLPSNFDPCHQFSSHWKKYLLVSPKTCHDNCHCHRHNYMNCQIFNYSIERNQQKSYIATIWYHQTQSTFSNQFHLLQCLFFTKYTTNPILKLPRASTPETFAVPPRVSPYTTQGFHNIFPTTKNIAEIFEPSNQKLLQKHHILFFHHLNSSSTISIALSIFITLMLPLQLWLFLKNYNI